MTDETRSVWDATAETWVQPVPAYARAGVPGGMPPIALVVPPDTVPVAFPDTIAQLRADNAELLVALKIAKAQLKYYAPIDTLTTSVLRFGAFSVERHRAAFDDARALIARAEAKP